jgi:uncharacterized membrane protein
VKVTLQKALPYLYVCVGVLGIVASFTLTYDKIHVMSDASYVPSCNINPVLSCGSVMKTQQASLLGVPNTIFGLMGFSMLTMLGIVLLAGATFKRWLWLLLNLGTAIGFVFFSYLFFQAIFRIHAICPYCFVVWLIVPPVLWYTTLYNLQSGNLRAKYLKSRNKQWILRHHGDILVVYFLVFFGIILNRFWYYWQTLI